MREFLYGVVELIAKAHEKLLTINDRYEYNLSDKELHFIVIGILGMALLLVTHSVFTILAKHNHVMVISWLYSFTLILVLTFAIEIGQKVTHTGVMEFTDIVFGIGGFMLMFLVFAILREIVRFISRSIRHSSASNRNSGRRS